MAALKIDHSYVARFRYITHMKRSQSLFLALTIVATLFSGGCTTTKPGKTRNLEALFQKADTDSDGRVSRDEFTDFMIEEVFANYDKNGSGTVTEAEFLAGGGKVENFKKINRSGTGKITLEEAKASTLIRDTMIMPFNEADVNGSGFVTWSEFMQARAKSQPYVR